MVVSTYGRGLYVLRDITPLEQADQVDADGARRSSTRRGPAFRDGRSGSAEFLYTLKAASKRPRDARDPRSDRAPSSGRSTGPARAGLNRVDVGPALRAAGAGRAAHDAARQPAHLGRAAVQGARRRGRSCTGASSRPQRLGPLAAPGQYTVRMTVGGQTVTAAVRRRQGPGDPGHGVGPRGVDRRAGPHPRRHERDGRDDQPARGDAQADRGPAEGERRQEGRVEQALRDLDRKMMDVELQLLTRTDLHSDDKWYVEAYKVYMNLVWLAGVVGTGAGDVAGGADYRPTDASLQCWPASRRTWPRRRPPSRR